MSAASSPDPSELERFRGYLRVLAGTQMAPHLQAKVDASDIVQQTLIQAVAAFDDLRGREDAQIAAWLRQILARQLANLTRDLHRQKRDVTREHSLQAALDESAQRLGSWLTAEAPSPSQQAVWNERLLALAEALDALPEAQREAIVLHHLRQWRLDDISRHMQRSPAAVAGLIKRGLRTLRQQLQDSDTT